MAVRGSDEVRATRRAAAHALLQFLLCVHDEGAPLRHRLLRAHELSGRPAPRRAQDADAWVKLTLSGLPASSTNSAPLSPAATSTPTSPCVFDSTTV
jgi:hypothetical protein